MKVLKSDDVQGILSLERSDRERFLWEASLGKGIWTFRNELRWAKKVLADFKQQFVD